ncbi:hypothetical protein I3760_02G137800 [Carya illinoinensis]|uniref:Protein kinase domain-containing protein n=1 Tax=Carya illinoinensis TaxID=32201 RepID=A0A922K1B2_CARIL|nr:U-box domain-containing protein 52-like isoform X1 [Carya illinoinensis]KAG2722679.1 hypothetical protein I3760_02G137800 [Carya illinoinensis]KAG6727640.1 hypothetical protein I3842_02G135600 [Carya illinoinensis]
MALSRTLSSMEIADVGSSTVIAIDKTKNSQFAVKWAVDTILSNSSHCILVHVRNQSFLDPHNHETDHGEGRPPTEQELQQFFLPYRGFCARKGIEAKEVILHDIDVPSALVDYIVRNSISNVVVGASNRNVLTRKFKDADVPSTLLKAAPASCAVYVISKGKVQAVRIADHQPQTLARASSNPGSRSLKEVIHDDLTPDTHDPDDTYRTSYGTGKRKITASEKVSFDRSSDQSLQITPQGNLGYGIWTDSPTKAADSFTSGNSSQGNSDSSDAFSFLSSIDTPFNFFYSNTASSDNLESSVASESPRSPALSQTPGLETEKSRLKLELTQAMEMYNLACKEIIVARQKAREIQQWRLVEERQLEEAQLAEEAALALAKVERQKTMAALEAAKMQQRLAEVQTQKRKNIEMQAKQKGAVDALTQNNVIYRRYSIDEIEKATDYFNSSLKIGEGGYGPVYKGLLDHTAVAIKILRPDLSQGQKQFQQEVEVLSCIRHPHMVLLLGACPEYGCLVYEYMDNGSLEDRLFQKDSTPPISWPTRFRIAAEISSGLLFLHQTKPEPIVHRDLKPGNILLDLNYRSKISDVGLARLIPPSVADSITQYHVTSAAGTFCYIDPEYQQTGLLGVKSDVYSLGVMLLQLLTAKPPIGLAHQIQKAIKKDKFPEMLDPSVTDWPIEDALSLAKLALKCCEMRKRDRPDLDSDLLPELERLRDLGIMYWSLKNMAIDDVRRPYNSVPEVRPTVKQDGEIDPDVEVDLQWRSI